MVRFIFFLKCICVYLLWPNIAVFSQVKSKDSSDICSAITESRERLACFDRMFNVPVRVAPMKTKSIYDRPEESKHPEEWQQVHDYEKKRTVNEDGFLLTVIPGNFIDSIIMTQPLDNFGIIVFSCVDKISRVELILNDALQDGVMLVEVVKNGQSTSQNRWLTDDSGYILRMGRGIPSINWMKNVLNESRIVLRIKGKVISVPLRGVSQKIKLLRQTCAW